MRASLMLAAVLAALAEPVLGCPTAIGMRAASDATRNLRTITGSPNLSCAPTAQSQQCTLFCLSTDELSDAKRGATYAFVVGVTGAAAREQGLVFFADVLFADRALGRARQAWSLPLARASALQQDVRAERMQMTEFMRTITRERRVVTAPKR